MARKKQTGKTSETEAINRATKLEADQRPLGGRRFTPRSFHSRRKRRKAEKKAARTKVAGVFTIFGRAILVLRNHWEVFGGLFMIFATINSLLTAGALLRIDLEGAKISLLEGGGLGQFATGLTLYGTLLSSGAGTANGAAGAYQMLLVVVTSLATVWALRQLLAGNTIRVRDALFNSSYPLVQVLIVLLVVFLQLLPILAASYLYYNLISLGIIIVGWQQAIVVVGCLLLALWSIYMVVASIFALYIATLPGMTPLKALRAAKDIVRYRRAMVFRKLLFLPVILLILYGVILTPLSLLLPSIAAFVFFLLGMASLPLIHAYVYTLYRELIN